MVDLAMHGGIAPVTLAQISERQKISLSYLEQLFGKLRRKAIVQSVRGPGGGYRLGRDMRLLTVSEIIQAVDERIDATQCGGRENCKDESKCITHDLWAALNQHIFDYLGGVTLRQLVDNQHAKAEGVALLRDMRASTKREGMTA
jgi:Rrf2 family iron-sulfur cluster assembly transcriptional regulator